MPMGCGTLPKYADGGGKIEGSATSRYIARVAVLDSGNPIWHVHSELAREMVARGLAADEPKGTRHKIYPARSIFCQEGGPPSAPSLGVRFTYYERLDDCAVASCSITRVVC